MFSLYAEPGMLASVHDAYRTRVHILESCDGVASGE